MRGAARGNCKSMTEGSMERRDALKSLGAAVLGTTVARGKYRAARAGDPAKAAEAQQPKRLRPSMWPAVQQRFVNVNGRRVHYLRAGNGPPVIMPHATPGRAQMLLPRIELISKT